MPLVLGKQLGRVLHLQLNSPENLNALSGAMIRALSERLAPEALRAAHVVLLTGAGRHFGAGHDLAEMASGRYDPGLFRQCSHLMQLVAGCPIPVVAAVQGCAFAAGCQLAASCDIVLAAATARFATPGVKIGLFCSTPSVAVTRAVPEKIAADMLFTARELSATEALSAGLVSRVVEASDMEALVAEALHTCHAIAEAPREVLAGGKALLLKQRGQSLASAYAMASDAMARGMDSGAASEGIAAFLSKRQPCWATEEAEVRSVLDLVKDGVAVVGASPDASRPSHKVFVEVRRAGPTFPVNPSCGEVAGDKCYKSLAEIPGSFAIVDVFRKSGAPAAAVVDEAIALAAQGRGVRAVWLQEGVRAPEAERRARAAGLLVVADRCLKVDLQRAALLPAPATSRL